MTCFCPRASCMRYVITWLVLVVSPVGGLALLRFPVTRSTAPFAPRLATHRDGKSGVQVRMSEQPQAADETERAAPSLVRICGACGWVVHGLVLEYSDGVRTGYLGDNSGMPLSLYDDAALQQRSGVWHEMFPGEQLGWISGRSSIARPTTYLCGEVMLHLSSGRTIELTGSNADVHGDPWLVLGTKTWKAQDLSFEQIVAIYTEHGAKMGPLGGSYLEPTFADGSCTGLRVLSRAQEKAARERAEDAKGSYEIDSDDDTLDNDDYELGESSKALVHRIMHSCLVIQSRESVMKALGLPPAVQRAQWTVFWIAVYLLFVIQHFGLLDKIFDEH